MENAADYLWKLEREHNLRKLRSADGTGREITVDGKTYVNLSSNDYLGIAGDKDFHEQFIRETENLRQAGFGSSSSRLITGNNKWYTRLEELLESIYPGKKALVFGSGYQANTGILSAITDKNDLILADKYSHASLIDGMRLSEATWKRFNHNDMYHLESLLRKMGNDYRDVWVVTESVFSMDGDEAPLADLLNLKEKYGFKIYLDEAHAFGVRGDAGAGVADETGMGENIEIIIGTFGKAAASYGAFAVTNQLIKELLVNRCRPLIYSTALPPFMLGWSAFVTAKFSDMSHRREHLNNLARIIMPDRTSTTHIIPILTPGNFASEEAAEIFRSEGFWVTPIRWPSVPKGKERIRISLTASLTEEDARRFRKIWERIGVPKNDFSK